MVFKITKKTTKEQLNAWIESLPPSKVSNVQAKPFDTSKFNGKLKLKIDGLKLQKQLRNEWS